METSNCSTIVIESTSGHSVVAQLVPIAVLIVFVNGIVFLLYMYAKDKRLRTPRNYLLFGLTVCDFMTGSINVPLTIILLTEVIALPQGLIVGFFLVVLHNLVVVLVVFHIFAITAERYFSIVHPFRHRWNMTKKSALSVIGVIWLTAVTVIAFLPVTWFRGFLNSPENGILTVTRQIHIILYSVLFLFFSYRMYLLFTLKLICSERSVEVLRTLEEAKGETLRSTEKLKTAKDAL